MPMADNLSSGDHLLRTLIYGYAKTKKTWWACMCAAAGYNVVLLDGDDGSAIVRQLPMEVRKKILVVNLTVQDTRVQGSTPVFANFVAKFLKAGNYFLWDETAKEEKLGMRDETHSHILVNASKLTPNEVVIFDSWKALSEAVNFAYANEKEIDLSDATKQEWDGYGWEGRLLTWYLKRMHVLNCHVIVVGHSTVYEKWDRRDKRNPILLEQRTQIVSCSGPHAKTIPTHFTDVLHFEQMGPSTYYVNAGGDKDRDGGSRLLAPQKYRWEDALPAKLFAALGHKPTGAPNLGFQYFKPGEAPPGAVATAPRTALPIPSHVSPAPIANAGTPGVKVQGTNSLAARLKLASKGG